MAKGNVIKEVRFSFQVAEPIQHIIFSLQSGKGTGSIPLSDGVLNVTLHESDRKLHLHFTHGNQTLQRTFTLPCPSGYAVQPLRFSDGTKVKLWFDSLS